MIVPFNQSPRQARGVPAEAPPSSVFLGMAAAQMHQEGRLFEPEGQTEAGNIDLNNRPMVKNPDGTTSTVRSITITDDKGKATVIPTVIGDKVVSNEDAIKHFKKTGEHLGVFDNEQNANDFAEKLHKQQAKQYGLDR